MIISFSFFFPLFFYHSVDTEAVDKDATNRLKRSQSLLLHDSAKSPPNEQPSKAKEAKSSGRHHRHHHKRHHHAHHLKNKGLNAQDSLESRIRSGMHALEEERKALREIVDEIETFGEKDREDITCKTFFTFIEQVLSWRILSVINVLNYFLFFLTQNTS